MDSSGLLDRLKEIGPLGKRFEQTARAALETAALLPEPERRRMQALVLEAAVRDCERLRSREALHRSLTELVCSLQEAAAQLREAAEQTSVALSRMRETHRRLARLRTFRPPSR